MLRAELEVEEEVIQQRISESRLLETESLEGRGQMGLRRVAHAEAYTKNGHGPAARKR
jgi:hypothetical protein